MIQCGSACEVVRFVCGAAVAEHVAAAARGR